MRLNLDGTERKAKAMEELRLGNRMLKDVAKDYGISTVTASAWRKQAISEKSWQARLKQLEPKAARELSKIINAKVNGRTVKWADKLRAIEIVAKQIIDEPPQGGDGLETATLTVRARDISGVLPHLSGVHGNRFSDIKGELSRFLSDN